MAKFLDPHRISIACTGGEELVVLADRVLIAVGAAPYRPSSIPFNGTNILDSDDLIARPHVPRSLTVIGAGVIGIEYATIFSALDVPVTLIEPRATILDFIDREIIDDFVHQLRDRGMTIRLGTTVARVEQDEQGWPGGHPEEDGQRVKVRAAALYRRPGGGDQGAGTGEVRA